MPSNYSKDAVGVAIVNKYYEKENPSSYNSIDEERIQETEEDRFNDRKLVEEK